MSYLRHPEVLETLKKSFHLVLQHEQRCGDCKRLFKVPLPLLQHVVNGNYGIGMCSHCGAVQCVCMPGFSDGLGADRATAGQVLTLRKEERTFFGRPAGTYRLTCDVKNPASSRKQSDWRHQRVWKEGQVFVLAEDAACGLALWARGSGRFLFPDEQRFHAVLEHLARVEEKPTDWLERAQATDAAALLDMLHDLGVITLVDVEVAMMEIESREESR